MRTKLGWLSFGLEIVLTILVGVFLIARRDPLGLLAFAWVAVSMGNSAWLLSSRIDEITSRLGFGVSVPITEMPNLIRKIESRMAKTASEPEHKDFRRGESSRRRNHGLLDELTALEAETH